VPHLPEPTWPEGPRPQMLHLDTTVPTLSELYLQHTRALELGARLLLDRSDDPDEPLFVYADPAGHPFCIFVAQN
jgi:Glyoxalase-like domain